jgi:hypothetical protein
MRPHCLIALLVLLAPGVARGADAPEQLLPSATQLYLRWDGIDAHRAAYARTALGKTMQGDTGEFITGVFAKVQEGLGSLLTVEQLLSGVKPEELRKLRDDAAQAAKLLPLLGKHGFILAAELRDLEPSGSVTLILPGAGATPEPLLGALRLATALAKLKVVEKKIDGRAAHLLDLPGAALAWWVEGKHLVLRFGTDKPEALVRAVTGKGDRLPDNDLFKRVSDFKTFRTSARAFVDIAAIVKVARKRSKEAAKMLADLGIDDVRSAVLYSGFEGIAERGLIEVDVPGPRRGLLALLKGKPFRLADVPPLPPDTVSWSMTNFDAAGFYDAAVQTIETVAAVVDADAAAEVKGLAKKINAAVGLDVRKDLLESLGDRFVQYSAPSEGPLVLGQTLLFKVKDEEKLNEALPQLVKGLAKLAGVEVQLRKRTYREAALREVVVRQRGFIFRPTWTIHKGWLAVSWFPQPVQAFVARQHGDLRAWKPGAQTRELLAALPQEYVSISYTDPRPGIKQVLSLAPLLGGLLDNLNPDLHFDVASIPGAQEATRHLFPNVSAASDDGKTVRLHSRASLALPLDVSGVDSYGILLFLSLGRIAK